MARSVSTAKVKVIFVSMSGKIYRFQHILVFRYDIFTISGPKCMFIKMGFPIK